MSLTELVVVARAEAADGVVLLTLRHPDGEPLPQWQPGAHLDLLLADGLVRNYLLCGALAASTRPAGVERESGRRNRSVTSGLADHPGHGRHSLKSACSMPVRRTSSSRPAQRPSPWKQPPACAPAAISLGRLPSAPASSVPKRRAARRRWRGDVQVPEAVPIPRADRCGATELDAGVLQRPA
ncbi:hypothetical protein GCM10017744_088960 [Streptomyces antimycoticus]|uniref:FAD-binding FR-type domain-containing protein n=1 Tax=Streptomyces antimycoticus TaxID=68175 RepID=A0A4D4JTJ0_9ACTN|nr:hypothetical protein SANT12839_000860 [Streptomyces antimycoticus]